MTEPEPVWHEAWTAWDVAHHLGTDVANARAWLHYHHITAIGTTNGYLVYPPHRIRQTTNQRATR